MADSLKGALQGLGNIAGDLSSLEVQTYVGDIQVLINTESGTVNFQELLAKAKASDQITLQLVTKLNFDGDGINLVPENPPGGHIQKAHDSALQAGKEVREGIMSLFKDFINSNLLK